MSIVPITKSTPNCYGVMCDRHGQCARYAAIETDPKIHTIATCSTGGDERPLFVSLKKEGGA